MGSDFPSVPSVKSVCDLLELRFILVYVNQIPFYPFTFLNIRDIRKICVRLKYEVRVWCGTYFGFPGEGVTSRVMRVVICITALKNQ